MRDNFDAKHTGIDVPEVEDYGRARDRETKEKITPANFTFCAV